MTAVVPTPIPAASRPIPSLASLNTWPQDMEEMHRWMRESLAPGALLLAQQALQNAQHAQEMADLAAAVESFAGAWSTLTGALNMPASVSHAGSLWILTANLANVATATPGVSASWVRFNSDAFGVAYGVSNVGVALDGLTALVAERVARVGGAAGAMAVPGGAHAGRPAFGSGDRGLRWSAERDWFEGWDGAGWSSFARRAERLDINFFPAVSLSSELSLTAYPWVQEILLDLKDVEMTATGEILVRFFDGASWTSSIFESSSGAISASTTAYSESTTALVMRCNGTGRKVNGRMSLRRYGSLGVNHWVASHSGRAGPTAISGGGVVRPTTNPLTALRLETSAGGFLDTGRVYVTLLGG